MANNKAIGTTYIRDVEDTTGKLEAEVKKADYLLAALEKLGKIEFGLALAHIIGVQDNTTQKNVKAYMNGIVNLNSIAFAAGVDNFGEENETAKALIRHDGTSKFTDTEIMGKVTSSSSGNKIIIDPATSSLEFEDASEVVRASMGFDDSDPDNKHTYLSLQNAPSLNVRHKALLKPGYQELSSDYYGGAGNVTTILSDCFNSVLQIIDSGRYGSSGFVKATASSDSGGFLEIGVAPPSGGLAEKTEISPTNLKITDSSSNTCEIKVDGMYINGTKSTGGGYTHPSTHPASMITAGTFPGIVKANNNTSYTTKQVRNMILSTGNAVSSQMANGDIWIKYE